MRPRPTILPRLSGARRTPAVLGVTPVDALEHVAQLGARQGQSAALSRRPDEPASIQPLGIERQPKPVMPEDLHQAAAAATEHEQITPMRIALEVLLHLQRQPRHPLAHVGVAGGDPNPHARRQRDHRSARSAAATTEAGALAATRTRTPPGRSITRAVLGPPRSASPPPSTTTPGTNPGLDRKSTRLNSSHMS